MVRESPTLASLGQTTITDIGGGSFKIDSFFDIFTKLSLDNGVTSTRANGSAERAAGRRLGAFGQEQEAEQSGTQLIRD